MAIDYSTIYKACQEDEEYKALCSQTRDKFKEKQSLRQKQRTEIRKIVVMDSLEDLAMLKTGNCEGEDKDVDKTLEEVTGIDSEGHFWRWSHATDLCFDAVIEATLKVSKLESMRDLIKSDIDKLNKLKDAREARIKADLEANEANQNAPAQ